MSRDQAAVLAEQFLIVFRARRCADNPGSFGYPLLWTCPIAVNTLTPTDSDVSSDLKPKDSTSWVIKDTAVALWDRSSSTTKPTNETALTNLAKRIAQDYFDWQTADEPGDMIVSGIAAVQPNALIDCIEIGYNRAKCFTRVSCPPLNAWPEELCHYDPATAECIDAKNNNVPTDKTPGIDIVADPISCIGGGGVVHIGSVDSKGAIQSIVIDNGGSYNSTPTVCFEDNGVSSGAKATATLTSGALTNINVDAGGTGYTTSSIVSLYGGGTAFQYTLKRLFLEDGRLVARFVAYVTVN